MKTKKVRRNSRGQYRHSWTQRLLPLVFLIASMILGLLIQSYFSEQELLDPCDGCVFNFSVRAYEEVAVTNAGQTASSEPKTEKEQIIEYITQVFGEEAPNAFNILYCENRGLRPDVVNHNRNGSIDYSIFQINSVHISGKEFKECTNADNDWKANVRCAKAIKDKYTWSAWACSDRIGVKSFW